MALTTLDPNSALITVDLQKEIVSLRLNHRIDDVKRRARALIDAFRERGLPVSLVKLAGSAPGCTKQSRPTGERPHGWTDLIPEPNQQPSDILVRKRIWGAFAGTDLETRLKEQGVPRW